ncbi:MAG: TetR/AcrR family transcriptional regulator [Sandaracinaceae bacterium]
MPRSPEDNQRIRDARRDELLRAAEQVFATKGFAQTRMSAIAAAAGVSHGLLYHYFPSKDALFGALIDEMMGRIAEDFDDDDGSPLERLERTLTRSLERVKESPNPNRLVTQTMLMGGVPAALRERAMAHGAGLVRQMVELISACQASGEIASTIDADQLASVFICTFRGMSIRPTDAPAELPFPHPSLETLLSLLQPVEKPSAATPPPRGRARAKKKKSKVR